MIVVQHQDKRGRRAGDLIAQRGQHELRRQGLGRLEQQQGVFTDTSVDLSQRGDQIGEKPGWIVIGLYGQPGSFTPPPSLARRGV